MFMHFVILSHEAVGDSRNKKKFKPPAEPEQPSLD